MKKRYIRWSLLLALFLSLGISKVSYADALWGKNADGIYVNSQGEAIERAVKKGIDVSHWQGEIDWDAVKESDVDFVIIRCGYGQDEKEQDDRYWIRNVTECERLGIPYGVYIYSYAKTEQMAQGEANHVLRLLKEQSCNLSYPVYLDFEDNSILGLTTTQYAKNAKAFCQVLEKAGYETGIYANKDWFEQRLTDSWFDTQNKWVAHYEPDSGQCGYEKTYKIWQCTQTGSVDGIQGNVCIDFLVEEAPSVTLAKVTSSSYNSHKLTWTSSENVDRYEIWCKGPGESKYTRIVKLAGDVGSYKVTKRTTGKNYYYKIRVYKTINGITYKTYSAVKKGKATLNKTTLSSVKRNNKKVTIRWKKVAGASGYKIYYSKKKGSGYKLLKTVKKGSTVSAKITVAKGKRYYKVRAYRNVNGTAVYGGYSAVKSCK